MTPPDFIALAKAYPEFAIFFLLCFIILFGVIPFGIWLFNLYAARRIDARKNRFRVRKAVKYFYRLEDK